jgi:hypothetical protein
MTPDPLPKAASMAITWSPTISISPPTNSNNNRCTTLAISGRAPPAIPTQVFLICAGMIFASAQACRMAALRLSRACCSPSRTTLLPPDVPVPSTEFSSPMMHEVLLPPPSIPRKILTSVVLSQMFLVYVWASGASGVCGTRFKFTSSYELDSLPTDCRVLNEKAHYSWMGDPAFRGRGRPPH